MKNKSKVEIKVGQEWVLNNGRTAFPLAFHEDGCLCYLPACGINCYKNYASTCFRTLISDPIWGDMSAHTIVTDEQWELYKIPDCAQYFCLFTKPLNGLHGNWERSHPTKDWAMFDYWRVPADFTAWEPVGCVHCGAGDDAHHAFGCPSDMHPDKVPEPEKPKCKLFPIDWTDDGPMIGVSSPANVMSCPKIDGYRLGWGFTDHEHWVEDTIANQKHTGNIDCVEPYNVEPYDTRSCDFTGNRKYAIGRWFEG